MRSLAPRLSLSLLVALLTAGLLWTVGRRAARGDVAFFRTRAPAGTSLAGTVREPTSLPSPLATERPLFPPSIFRRWALDEQQVARFVDLDGDQIVYDPWSYFAHPPHMNLRRVWKEHPEGVFFMRTNGLGLRMDAEPSAVPPDLRVLVLGDSHTDGVCSNSEAYPALLQAALTERRPGEAVEVVNAGTGGFGFYHYLGMLERFVPLAPEVLVLTVYTGNDFYDSLGLYHYFNGTAAPTLFDTHGAELDAALELDTRALAQSFLAYKYFDAFPEQLECALQAARDVTTEIQVTCLRNGIRPVAVLLPPMSDVQWELRAEEFEGLAAELGLEREDLTCADALTDSYLAFLRERHFDCLDLRAPFRSAGEPLYWRRDHHLNLAGQALVARELLPLVEAAVPAGTRRVRQDPLTAPDAAAARALRSPGAPRTEGEREPRR